jgi:hypothetical protein
VSSRTESRFRVWAFHIFYRRTFARERDLFLRFGKALEASSKMIVKPELLQQWHLQHGRKTLSALIADAGSTTPSRSITKDHACSRCPA